MKKSKFNAQRGQVGLIVLLVSMIALTVGVSVANRSLSGIVSTTSEDESTDRLQAVESVLDEIESVGLDAFDASTLPEGVELDVVTSKIVSNSEIKPGQVLEVVNLILQENDSITINILDPAENCDNPRMFVVSQYNAYTSNFLGRELYSECQGGTVKESFEVNALGNVDTLRIKPLVSSAKFSLEGAVGTQGLSTVVSATGSDGETRTVQVTKSEATNKSIFDYVLFAESITTNNP